MYLTETNTLSRRHEGERREKRQASKLYPSNIVAIKPSEDCTLVSQV